MRAGPLSSPKVIETLNRSFVPVYLSNEDYADDGPAPRAEKAERDRIFAEARAAGLSVGTVHVYVLDPDGRAVDSAHVAEGAKTDVLIGLLERNVARFHPQPGPPLVAPRPQAPTPVPDPGGLLLHLVARSLDGRGAWGGVIPEDWFLLESEQAAALTCPPPVEAGRSWTIDRDTAVRLLERFYPATENNDLAKNRIERLSLRATLVSVQSGTARARLDGDLRMVHPFYHKDDGKTVEARVVGFVDFAVPTRLVRSLRLVTESATYNGGKFGVALESVEVDGP
jgi:hypothetical protein